jgi:hypothetical protein
MLTLRSTLVSLIVPAVVWALPTASAAADEASSLCETSRQALVHASRIRNLPTKEAVPCLVQDKSAVMGFIHETLRTDRPPQKLQMEEITYRAIGLIPDSFSYASKLVEFLASQIGGYYDPKRKHFIMAAWLPASVQAGVAVHELTHALQDQHYNLRRILDGKSGTTDSDIAVSALIEGDASAVMFDYERNKLGQPAIQNEPSIDALILVQVLGASMGPIGGEIPDSLKGLLIFPYTSGLRFVHALLRNGGYNTVSDSYGRLPKSSREILHPHEYLAGTFQPNIPQPSQIEGATESYLPEYSDVLGEFGIASLLSGEAPSRAGASEAAQGWRGDRVGVFPLQSGKRLVSWLTRWESEVDAAQFYDAYRKFLLARYKKDLPTSWTELTAAKSGRITVAGSDVSVQFLVQ